MSNPLSLWKFLSIISQLNPPLPWSHRVPPLWEPAQPCPVQLWKHLPQLLPQFCAPPELHLAKAEAICSGRAGGTPFTEARIASPVSTQGPNAKFMSKATTMIMKGKDSGHRTLEKGKLEKSSDTFGSTLERGACMIGSSSAITPSVFIGQGGSGTVVWKRMTPSALLPYNHHESWYPPLLHDRAAVTLSNT